MSIVNRVFWIFALCGTLSACSTLNTLKGENTARSGDFWVAKDTGIPFVLSLTSEIFHCKTSMDGTPAVCSKADMRLAD
jgi:hypothetical protein